MMCTQPSLRPLKARLVAATTAFRGPGCDGLRAHTTQVVNFTKNLATIFTSDQLQEAFTQLAETVEDDVCSNKIH
eukprot:5053962-Pleurochrysis_carterae.AAC.3